MKKQKIIGIMLVVSMVVGAILQLNFGSKVYASDDDIQTPNYTIVFNDFTRDLNNTDKPFSVDAEVDFSDSLVELEEDTAQNWDRIEEEDSIRLKEKARQCKLLKFRVRTSDQEGVSSLRGNFITPLHLYVNETYKAPYQDLVENGDSTVSEVSSSDTEVVTIEAAEEGRYAIKGIKAGTATLTITEQYAGGATEARTCRVTIEEDPDGIAAWTVYSKDNKAGVTVDVGEEETLEILAGLKQGIPEGESRKRFTTECAIADETIASIECTEGEAFSRSGTVATIKVKGLKAGTTTLNAVVQYYKGGTDTFTFNVRVNGSDETTPGEDEGTTPGGDGETTPGEDEGTNPSEDGQKENEPEDKGKTVETPEWNVKFDKSKLNLVVGDKTEITANAALKEGFTPLEEAKKVFNITWKVSDPSILKLTAQTGEKMKDKGKAGSAIIEALKEGKTTLVATVTVLGTKTQVKAEIPVTVTTGKESDDGKKEDEKKDDNKESSDKESGNKSSNESGKKNGTESPDKIPQTGSIAVIMLVVISLGIASAIIAKKKYNN